jgi:hypothetical protein
MEEIRGNRTDDLRNVGSIPGLATFYVHLRILSANSHRGPFGRKMGDMEHAGEANPGRQTPRREFADSISVGTENRRKGHFAAGHSLGRDCGGG